MGPAVSVDASGEFTLVYKLRFPEVADMCDALSMSIARDYGDGIRAGMVVARVGQVVEGETVDMYRVIFHDNSEGYYTDRPSVEYMRNLFLSTPGLEPIILVIQGE